MVAVWGLGDNGVRPKKRSRTAERMQQEKMNRKLKLLRRINPNATLSSLAATTKANRQSIIQDDFDMKDLTGSLSKEKPSKESLLLEDANDSILVKNTVSMKPPSSREADLSSNKQSIIDRKELKEASQLLKTTVTEATAPNAAKKKHLGRQANESKRAYNKRVQAETRQIIKQQKTSESNPEKKRKKKEFLNAKKKHKKKGTHAGSSHAKYNNTNSEDEFDSDDHGDSRRQNQQQQQDDVHFTVQADRPPTFQSLPRGAFQKKQQHAGNKKNNGSLTDQEVRQEQDNLERMRLQVQQQYAIIKAKRKRAGDFHL